MQIQQRPTEPFYTSAGVDLFTINSKEIVDWWPIVLFFIKKIDNADWTTEEVYEDLLNARAQLWGVARGSEILGIWITKILSTKKTKYGLVWIAAGKGLEEGIDCYSRTEEWFKEMGCQYIEIHGRPGWKKLMRDYEVKHIALRKNL